MQNNFSCRTSRNHKFIANTLKFFLGFSLICSAELFALPELQQVVSGDINSQISADKASLQINQNTDKAILNWNTFNIAAQEGVHFQQPQNGVCLNRVDAANGMSLIDGSLSATGRIYLINQAGMLFGETAQVNVGGIIASTIDITDSNFLRNKHIFDQSSDIAGAIINRGTINIADQGLGMFLGASVVNDGVIQTRVSNVNLSTGSSFVVDFYGNQVINFQVTAPTTQAASDENGNVLPNGVDNPGKIINDAGTVFMSGKAAQGVFDNLINMDGVIKATSVMDVRGSIVLLGDDVGVLKVNGQVDATGTLDNSRGGYVMVAGADVQIKEAQIDVSGKYGAGTMHIGDWSKGLDTRAPEVRNIHVGNNAMLKADAIEEGNGGSIMLWSKSSTQFLGTASARGGAISGNGGFVELSSAGDLLYPENLAYVDTSAPNGETGTLLFDPKFIIVQASGGSTYLNNLNNLFANNAAGTTTLTPSSIVSAGQVNNIRLQANSDIIFNDALTLTSSGKTLTLNAGRSVLFNANVTTNNGAIIVTANDTAAQSANRSTVSTGNPAGDAETVDGNIIMANGTSLSSGTAALTMTIGTSTTSPFNPGDMTLTALTGGAITLTTSNSVTVSGNIAAGSNLTVDVGISSAINGVISGAGSFTKKSAGTLTLNGANTYTGATAVNAGTLRAGVANTISSTSGLAMTNAASATFDLNDFNQTVGTLSGGGASGGNITLGSASLTVTQGANNTYTGVISGSGGITKAGGSTLTLSGVNTFTGAVAINAGTLRMGVANAISSASSVTLANTSGAAMELNNFSQSIGTLTGGGASGGNISLGSAALTVTQGGNGTYAGIISGTGTLTKAGSSTLTLSGTNTFTGTVTVNGGILQAGAANVISSSAPVVLANTSGVAFDLNNFNQAISTLSGGGASGGNITLGSATLTVTQGANNSYSGAISGTGGITKAGASVLTLFGTNTYTGTTTINAGTLQAGAVNSISGTVSLANVASATLDLNNFSQTLISLTGGGASGGNISLGSANLTVTQGTNGSYSGVISGTGSVTKDGASTLTLNGTNTYSGTTTINAGTLQAGAANVISSSSPLVLANTSGAIFDLNSFNQSVSSLSGGGNNGGNINLGTATLIVTQSAANTYAGVISGSGNVTLNGSATLTLSGANTYTGTTNINVGTLKAGAANVLANNSSVVLANVAGAKFDLNNFNQEIGNLSGGGTTGGNITLGSATLIVNQASANTYAGVISGTGGLTKQGTATLTLSGVSTYSGDTTINTGKLQTGAQFIISTASPITLADDATAIFDLNNFDQSIHSVAGGGLSGGNITLGSAVLTIDQDSTATYAGVISGTGRIVLSASSSGTLTLTGANTYTGTTTLNGGTLIVSSDANLGTAPGSVVTNSLTLNGGTVKASGSFTLNPNRGVTLGVNSGTVTVDPTFTLTYNGVIAGTGALNKSGSGILLVGGVNTYTGATNINAGKIKTAVTNAIANSSAVNINNLANTAFNLNGFDQTIGTLSGGGASGGNIVLGAGNLTVNQASANTFAGIIMGSGGLTANGAARLTLAGANTYTGPTVINGGTLQAGAANVITSASTVTIANTSGAVFDLNNFNQEIGDLSGGGASGGNVTLGSATLTVDQNNPGTYAGIISGSGNVVANGSSVLTLSGINTYTGATTINTGTLRAGAADVIAISSGVSIANDASASFDLNNFDQTVNGLSGGGNTGGNVTLGSATLTVTPASNQSYAGVISQTGGLTLSGSAILTLSGANSYTGDTNVNAGTLRAGATNIITSSDQLVMANTAGATFDLNNFDQEINSLSGGGSTGGNITLGSATLTVDQGANQNYAGVISGTGNVILDGSATLNLSGANTYTGATTVNSGVLQAGATNVIAATNSLTLADSATAEFDLNNFNQTVGSVNGGGASGGNVALGSGVLLVNQTSPGTYAGVISGTGNVVLSTGSTNTLALTGVNSYSGSTSVRAGKLSISDDTNLGTAPVTFTANDLNINGGTLEASGTFLLDPNRGITIGANGGTIQVDPTFALEFNGVVSGNGSFTKSGSGVLSFGGDNTYTGATNITAGTLRANGIDVIASSSSLTISNVASASFNLNDFDQAITFLSGGGASGGNITLGAGTLTVNQATNGNYAGIISGSGGLTTVGSSTLTLSGANSFTGPTNINGGILQAGATNVIASSSEVTLANTSGAVFDLNNYDQSIAALSGGGANGGNVTLGSATLTVGEPVVDTYSGIISGAGGVTLDGVGTLVLTASNTYTGTTNIVAGTLQAGATNVLSPLSPVNLADDNTAILDMNNYDQCIGSLSGGGATGGNIMLSNATLTVNQEANDTFAGVMSDFGGGNVIMNGPATLTLAGANTYAGTTTVNAGVLQAGATDVIANSSVLLMSNTSGATFDLNDFDQTIGNLSGGGGAGGSITLGTADLTVQQGVSDSYAGIISGTGGLVKTGAATLNLSGVNAYTGATMIDMGVLQAGAVDTISSSTPILINSGALFDLNGYSQAVDVLDGTTPIGVNVTLGGAVLTVNSGANLVIEQ